MTVTLTALTRFACLTGKKNVLACVLQGYIGPKAYYSRVINSFLVRALYLMMSGSLYCWSQARRKCRCCVTIKI